MNLFKFINKNIHMNKLKNVNENIREMAIVRYVMMEVAKLFYRDYTFFLDKENIIDREFIYNRELNLTDVSDFAIICKSYCIVIKDLLKQHYGIDSELISPFTDKFRHIDLLIKTTNGKKYIVDPLDDLIEMQVGAQTNKFASKSYYNEVYANMQSDISFISIKELEEIDEIIGYKKDNIYLNVFLDFLKVKLDNIENLLENNEDIAIKLLGKKYNRHILSQKEKTELKLKFISSYLNNRVYINGIVDLIMFSNNVIKTLFSDEERKEIHSYSFFVDDSDVKDRILKEILECKEGRRRGICINFAGNNYIFSLNPKVMQYSNEEWQKIVEKNNIFIKPYYHIRLLQYLRINNADRNIIHNNEFLRLFSIFEGYLLEEGKSIEDIIRSNITIKNGVIYTKYNGNSTSYRMEDGNLVIKEYGKNLKQTVFYKDEGRSITYKTEPILSEKQRLYLKDFDSNGLFDLEEVTGIEKLVATLSNGKYLSRNASFYESKTYSELSLEREKLIEILTEDLSKKNFVILEYLANASAKVYFEELKKKIENQFNQCEQAQKCFEEDCANIIRFFKNEPLQEPIREFPKGESRILERHIEMDNKQILYIFCLNLKFNRTKHILTPGLGSIFVGPMLKSMYGFDYTNVLFSLYSNDEKLRSISEREEFENLLSNDRWKTTLNELLLIDDNVGSCNTMNTIREQLRAKGKNCSFGAIKYNWEFYKKVKNGELSHPTFDVSDVDFLSIIDDPGYWIMRDSLNALKTGGGDAYVQIMEKEGFRQLNVPDIFILMQLAEKFSKSANIDLYNMKSGVIKKSSALLCRKLKAQIKDIIRESKFQNRSRDE